MAKRSGFDAVFLNNEGQPLINLNIRVLDSDGNLAQIYSSKTGASLKPQPIITESSTNGLVQFWAEPGYYQVEVSDAEIPPRISTRIIPFDAVAGDTSLNNEGISLAQIPAIPENKIQTNAITRTKILDGEIITSKLAPNAVTKDKVTNDLVMPIGSIIQFAGNTAPSDWLLCRGQEISRTGTYENLFNVLGTSYGRGNGSTTFNLPDLQGRVPVGMSLNGHSSVNALGDNEGGPAIVNNENQTGTAQTNRRPSHSHTASASSQNSVTGISLTGGSHGHTITDPGHYHTVNSGTTGTGSQPMLKSGTGIGFTHSATTGITVNTGGSHEHTVNEPNSGQGHSHIISVSVGDSGGTNDSPSFLVVNYIIKAV